MNSMNNLFSINEFMEIEFVVSSLKTDSAGIIQLIYEF